MTILRSGDVVTGFFTGAAEDKVRPAVIVSSQTYHENRPDVVLCFLTTQIAGLNSPTDFVLHDWREAGLKQPSALRCFFVTVRASEVSKIGHLSGADWQEVQARLRLALEVA